MRKGLELSGSGDRLGGAAKATSWRVDLLFPAFLVGVAYVIAKTFFGF